MMIGAQTQSLFMGKVSQIASFNIIELSNGVCVCHYLHHAVFTSCKAKLNYDPKYGDLNNAGPMPFHNGKDVELRT